MAKTNTAQQFNAGDAKKASHWVNIKVTVGDKAYSLGGLGLTPDTNAVHRMLIDELAKADSQAELLGSIIKGGEVYITEVGQTSEPTGTFKLG